jgi:hypothetical protein
MRTLFHNEVWLDVCVCVCVCVCVQVDCNNRLGVYVSVCMCVCVCQSVVMKRGVWIERLGPNKGYTSPSP